jgi:hypothetical protein
MAQDVELAVLAWLRRRRLLADRDDDAGDRPRSALDACLSGSLGLGQARHVRWARAAGRLLWTDSREVRHSAVVAKPRTFPNVERPFALHAQ